MASSAKGLLTDLLKEVSRSFYLTLRVLPSRIRPQIGLAYLLARTTDTIADTEVLPPEQRFESLQRLRERILGNCSAPLNFQLLAGQQKHSAERALLERCEESLEVLRHLSAGDLQLVQQVLDTIISGQELDLRRFANASGAHILALRSPEELDDYTYRVAGCVGQFWTRICRAHLFPEADLNVEFLLNQAVRFGKGLQMVNILRDLPKDLRLGRCYLPERALAEAGLAPAQLLDPATEPRVRPIYHGYLTLAEDHLLAGWAYTTALPRRCVRVRLACAWPILIGLKTIALLRHENVLDPARPIKITRSDLRKTLFSSIVYYPWPTIWQKLVRR